jgi:hypothetical protein
MTGGANGLERFVVDVAYLHGEDRGEKIEDAEQNNDGSVHEESSSKVTESESEVRSLRKDERRSLNFWCC